MQRTYRMPKEVRVEPQKFAAELIHRLEAVQRTREAEEKLEERLKRVRMVSGPWRGRLLAPRAPVALPELRWPGLGTGLARSCAGCVLLGSRCSSSPVESGRRFCFV